MSQNAMSLCPTCGSEVFQVINQSGAPLVLDRKPLTRGQYRLAQGESKQLVALPVPSLYQPHTCPER